MPHTWFQGFSSYCTAVPTLQVLKCNKKVKKQSELYSLRSIECLRQLRATVKIWVTNVALDRDLACSLTFTNKNIIISLGLQTFPPSFMISLHILTSIMTLTLTMSIIYFGAVCLQFLLKPVHSLLSYFANRQADKQDWVNRTLIRQRL